MRAFVTGLESDLMAGIYQTSFQADESKAFQRALDIVRGLEELDLSVVPHVPSRDMIDAGARVGGVSSEFAEKIYRAMVLAAR